MPGVPGGLSGADDGALLDALAQPVVVASPTGELLFLNPAAEKVLGVIAADALGRPLTSLIGADLEDRIELSLQPHRATDGQELLIGTLVDPRHRLELERHQSITRYLTTSRDVMTRLAVGEGVATIDEAAPQLLEALGDGLRWDAGAVWRPASDGLLHAIAHWSANDDDLGVVMTEGVAFRPGDAIAGQVARDAEAMWVEHIATDETFIRRARAARVGIRSCFAFPIFVNGDVHAVVEMYSRAVQPPEPELLAILQTAGLEIGRYLERAQSRRHLVEMAEALQASLLPPQSPVVPGLDIAVRYHASSGVGQIGGDFFDVFPLPDGEWAVFIGDVAGRGPRAAALTALARYTLRAAAVGASGPSGVLAVLNDVVRRELETGDSSDERFLTVVYLVLRPTRNGLEVSMACGGHPYPLARRADGSTEEIVCEGDLIGAFDVHEATDKVVPLEVGDALVLVTDGVTEARRDGVEFGDDGLRNLVARATATTASELADEIEAAVLEHVGGHAQDDLAIVVLRLPAVIDAASADDPRVADRR